jgi:pyruvate formate lyase activating enzyme
MRTSGAGKNTGLVFNIQRFSLHDGPGIRTTVFFKGCPLRCRWCSNPESWNVFPEIMTFDFKCIRCGKCENACPSEAISVSKEGRKLDRRKCDLCLKCAEVCPTGGIRITGEYVGVDEVLKEVERDRLFYLNSGGGVTISGGEPLLQGEFILELLRALKGIDLHTALDTCGYCAKDVIEKALDHVDLMIFDLKHMNSESHKWGTGKSNSLILENARRAAARVSIWLRFPFIPGFNDSTRNLKETAEFAARIEAKKVSILPYHAWGKSKYGKLGRRYRFGQAEQPSEEQCEETASVFESFGLDVKIGA